MWDDPGATQPVKSYSVGESTTLIETRPEPPQSNSSNTSSGHPLVAHLLQRLLPLASALMIFAASWLPWVTLGIKFDPGFAPHYEMPVSYIPLGGAAGLDMLLAQNPLTAPLDLRAGRGLWWIWSAAPFFGVLLSLFLLRQRFAAKRPVVLYGFWLVLATVLMLPVVVGLLTTVGPMSCFQVCAPMPVLSREPQPGLWLAIGGLVLGWVAVVMHLRARASGDALAIAYSVTPARFSPRHLRGAAVTLLGGALWAFGLYAVPWATSGCTGLHLSLNHFVRGTCSGLDGYDVLTPGLGSHGSLSWPLLVLVSMIGLFVVISAWLPRLTRSTWIAGLVWGLMATWLFIVGAIGVQATLASPPVLTTAGPEVWDPNYGIFVCAAGIVLGWVGIALLARAEISQARQVV